MLDVVIFSIWPIHWNYFQQQIYIYIYLSSAFINLAWVIHPPYACQWTNVTVISLQNDWPDRVMLPWESRETELPSTADFVGETKYSVTATPSVPFLTAWSMASKMGKKKGFCSYAPLFPSSHSYYIYLKCRAVKHTALACCHRSYRSPQPPAQTWR